MSNEAKWTEGPWRHALRNANEIMTTFHGVQIGRIYIDVTTDNEAGDAHLIAAAPELYEALDMLMDASGPGDAEQILAEERENIMALLAKARGETS